MNSVFSARNKVRCESKKGFNHKLSSWSASDWMVAMVGEIGEACNIVKKLNRVRDGIPGNSETPEELRRNLRKEIADAYTYLDLFCQSQGIDLGHEVATKFNEVSERMGYNEGIEFYASR